MKHESPPYGVSFDDDGRTVTVRAPYSGAGEAQHTHHFQLDGVLSGLGQEAVYNATAREAVEAALGGVNATVFAYGQTGAGKTYTMSGPQGEAALARSSFADRGMTPRAVSHAFARLRADAEAARKAKPPRPPQDVRLRVSYVEIYNEVLYDLLAGPSAFTGAGQGGEAGAPTHAEGELQIHEDQRLGLLVRGLREVSVEREEDALALLFEGERTRAVAGHSLNVQSSRSHAVFRLCVERRGEREDGGVVHSRLHLVDLAGSERLAKTQSAGTVAREASYINKSLSFLEQVIVALSQPGREHVPYRSSKLTHLLKDALGGNCVTVMIANVWAEPRHVGETLSTLRFGQRMRNVQTYATVNVRHDPEILLKRAEREIAQLKQELAQLASAAASAQRAGVGMRAAPPREPYTARERLAMRKQVAAFLRSPIRDESAADGLDFASADSARETLLLCREVYHMDMSRGGPPGGGLGGAPGGGSVAAATPGAAQAATPARPPSAASTVATATAAAATPAPTPAATPSAMPMPSPALSVTSDGMVTRPATRAHEVQSLPDIHRAPPSVAAASPAPAPRAVVAPAASGAPPTDARGTSAAFAAFVAGPGKEAHALATENKAALREKRRAAKALAVNVNVTKRAIDEIRGAAEAARKRGAASAGEVSEEDYATLLRLKELKREYREAHDELKSLRSEIEYLAELAQAATERLMEDFKAWAGIETVAGSTGGDGHGGALSPSGPAGELPEEEKAFQAALVAAAKRGANAAGDRAARPQFGVGKLPDRK